VARLHVHVLLLKEYVAVMFQVSVISLLFPARAPLFYSLQSKAQRCLTRIEFFSFISNEKNVA